MSTRLRVTADEPDVGARTQLMILRIGAAGSRRFARGRGLGRYVKFVSRFFSRDNRLTVWLDEDTSLTVPMYDTYWLPPLLTGGAYEPEIAMVLSLVLSEDCAFIDCGANVGYWSVMVSRQIRSRERIVAIEASSQLYALLVANARANRDAFVCVHAAVWHTSGATLRLASDTERHSWSTVDAALREELRLVGFEEQDVVSTTIDSHTLPLGDPDLIVLKIDVEGAEMAALSGAKETLKRNVLVIYEEHGRDKDPSVSRLLVEDHGFEIFHYDEERRLRRVNVAAVAEARPQRAHGYNFFACPLGSPVHSTLSRWSESDG